jgi:hypothetical protein
VLALEQVANDQEGPPVADQVQGTRHRTVGTRGREILPERGSPSYQGLFLVVVTCNKQLADVVLLAGCKLLGSIVFEEVPPCLPRS